MATIGGSEAAGISDSPDRATTKVSLDRYRQESRAIFSLLEQQLEYLANRVGATSILERASIDEAYIDVTELASEELERVLNDRDAWAEAAGCDRHMPHMAGTGTSTCQTCHTCCTHMHTCVYT